MKNLYLSKEEIVTGSFKEEIETIVVFSKGSEDGGKGRRIEEESVGI